MRSYSIGLEVLELAVTYRMASNVKFNIVNIAGSGAGTLEAIALGYVYTIISR